MAKDKKKNAKLAHNKKKAEHSDDLAASSLRIITGDGHLVEKAIDMFTACGRPRIGWHYGTDSDVTCFGCGGGEVPPGLPADGDLSKLPILDVKEFEKFEKSQQSADFRSKRMAGH